MDAAALPAWAPARAFPPNRGLKFYHPFDLLRYGVAIAAARLSALRLVLSMRRGLRGLFPFALSTFALARSSFCRATMAAVFLSSGVTSKSSLANSAAVVEAPGATRRL